jgi:uncharacterized protein YhaN
VDTTRGDQDRAEAENAEVCRKLQDARAVAAQASNNRDQARTVRDRAKTLVEERRRIIANLDRAGAECAQAQAQAALDEIPDTDTESPVDLAVTQTTFDRLEKELRRIEDDLRESRGRLAVVGGAVANERLQQEREAVDRLQEIADDLELEYAASLLLQETLKETEQTHASHLGAILADPITKRFQDLTRGTYGAVSLDPGLKARGIDVGGEMREPDALSVGTREQLATLVRLALATELKSCLLLDDQLVQSDPQRLDWFRNLLKVSVREQGMQIIIFTCRREDYAASDELPGPEEARRETDAGRVAVVNLEHTILRR